MPDQNGNNETKYRETKGAGASVVSFRCGFFAHAINAALATLQTAATNIDLTWGGS
jgi:hypothetical protein